MKLFPTLTAGALALAISSPAFAAEVEWKMTAAIGEGSFLYQNFMERFADNVGMITQDRVNIQPPMFIHGSLPSQSSYAVENYRSHEPSSSMKNKTLQAFVFHKQ